MKDLRKTIPQLEEKPKGRTAAGKLGLRWLQEAQDPAGLRRVSDYRRGDLTPPAKKHSPHSLSLSPEHLSHSFPFLPNPSRKNPFFLSPPYSFPFVFTPYYSFSSFSLFPEKAFPKLFYFFSFLSNPSHSLLVLKKIPCLPILSQ